MFPEQPEEGRGAGPGAGAGSEDHVRLTGSKRLRHLRRGRHPLRGRRVAPAPERLLQAEGVGFGILNEQRAKGFAHLIECSAFGTVLQLTTGCGARPMLEER